MDTRASLPTITYCSTRGGETGVNFESVVMGGLARDRGLYVPEVIPRVSAEELDQWDKLTFPELAHRIMSKYISAEEIPSEDLLDICERSVANFRTEGLQP